MHMHREVPLFMVQQKPNRRLATLIRTQWMDLTEDEIASVEFDRPSFYDAVTRKYALKRADIEQQLRHWERQCTATT